VTPHQARFAAIALAGTTVAFAFAGIAVGGGTLGGVYGADRSLSVGDAFQLMALLATAAVGLTIAVRRPGNPIGWLFSWYGLITAIYLAAGGYAVHDAAAPGSLPGAEWAAWLRNWADRCVASLILLAFLLFPTGRLASPRWRPALVLPPLMALGMAARAFVPGPMDFLGVVNPVGIAWVPLSVNNGFVGGVPAIVGAVVAYAQLSTRYRAAGGAERDQIKWLAIPVIALVIALLATVADLALGGTGGGVAVSALYAVVQLMLPVCMAIAVLRYRLYDIDVLINRALVYGATTAGIALAFFGGIVVLQALLRPLTSGSEVAVAISTLASVALFQPLRTRVQHAVDRRFYRSRYDAAHTLDAFSVRLRDQVALDAVRTDLLEAVRETVQPAHASLWLRPE
jgi:hypothetical protein